MTEQQLLKFIAVLVEFASHFKVLSKGEAQWVIQNATTAIGVMVVAIQKAYVETQRIPEVLDLITITLSATTTPTTVHQAYAVNTSPDADLKIGYSAPFVSDFGFMLIEPFSKQSLQYAKLLRNATEEEIFAGLKETTPADLLALLKMQGKGQDGRLLNNGLANLFRMRNNTGELRTVSVYWSADGWRVYSYSVDGARVWGEGNQVFSRN